MWTSVYAVLLQEQHAAYQAGLHQALFDTEQTARRVANTVPQDTFAAAIVAHFWLQKVAGIDVTSFGDITQKRAWAAASDTLRAAVEKGRVECGERIGRYLAGLEEWRHLYSFVGDNPGPRIAGLQQLAAAAEKARQLNWLRAKIGGAMVLGSLPVGVIFGFGSADMGAGVFVLLLLGGCVLGAISLFAQSGLKTEAARAAHVANVAAGQVAALDAFIADPQLGGFLSQCWEHHPLLFKEPIPDGPPASQGPASVQMYVDRQVVERQVVVTRCRYCQQMTPVDAMACTNCGGAI